jgi:glycosyltransferase
MRISIITCVLNNSNLIKESIKSFQTQIYKNKEHVIIDGGSIDGTLEVIKKFKNRNLILSTSSDNGIYDALNKGINLSSGDIVGILHSDDFYKDNKVLKTIAETFKKTDADLVYGDLVYVNKKYPFKVLRYWKAGKYFKKNLFNGWMPPHPTVFIKRSVFNRIGKYKTNYKISSDYDFLVRVFRKKNIKKIYISKILVNMRIGGMSNNSIKNIFKKSIEDFKIIKKNKIGGFLTLLNKNFSKISQFLY